MATKHHLLEIRKLTKRFSGVTALEDVDLDIRRGETHVLLGENGAGKLTFVKILSGVHKADSGEITYDDNPYEATSPHDALRQGVRLIHQEVNLLSYLSVAENIFFEHLPHRFGIVDRRALHTRAQALLDEVGLNLSSTLPVSALSVAQMQMVEIAKALSSESKLLIMDEPTASLTTTEIVKLFEIIRRLKERGVTIIYISHRLQEIFDIGDRFTVLRNGQKVATQPLADVEVEDIVKLMVGRELAAGHPFRESVKLGPEVMRVEDLRPKTSAHSVSFSVRAGEMLGIAGLVGAGRTEVLRAIFGADFKSSGAVFVDNQPISVQRPKDAVRFGISFVTENRKEEGLLLDMPCYVNITVANLVAIARGGLLQSAVEHRAAKKLVKDLSIKTPSIHQAARNLSGGNQQKIVLAKWLFRDAKVLMVDEPTRGIDVGARYEIYQLLWDLAEAGKAIILVSSDLPELTGLCHRILVLSKGKISGSLNRDEFDPERILNMAFQEHMYQSGKAA